MSCFLELKTFAGTDQTNTANKLALMFKIPPQQAQSIMDKVTKGQGWRFQNQFSEQQAAVAEKYLKGLGFQVKRSGEPVGVGHISEQVALDKSTGTAVAPARTRTETLVTTPGDKPVTAPKPRKSTGKFLNFGFHGTGGGLFKIQLVNWLLTVLTVGIYYFWGKTNERRYLWEQTSFSGDRFFYHGTGGELFKGAIIFNLIFIGLVFGVSALGMILGPGMAEVANMVLVLGIWLLIPAILVGAYRYRLSRTAWRGIRFSFRGTRKEAIGLYIKGILLTGLTLGLYWPYFQVAKRKFWMGQSYFGNLSMQYEGNGKDIFGQTLLAVLLIPLTLGFYIHWYQAYLARYHWSKTQFAGGQFNFDATGGELFSLNLVNMLLLMVTLGIAMPWVVTRSLKFTADHLKVTDNIELNKVVQDAKKSGALAEGAADGMDIDMDFGI